MAGGPLHILQDKLTISCVSDRSPREKTTRSVPLAWYSTTWSVLHARYMRPINALPAVERDPSLCRDWDDYGS